MNSDKKLDKVPKPKSPKKRGTVKKQESRPPIDIITLADDPPQDKVRVSDATIEESTKSNAKRKSDSSSAAEIPYTVPSEHSDSSSQSPIKPPSKRNKERRINDESDDTGLDVFITQH
jgi:hypothetical protein